MTEHVVLGEWQSLGPSDGVAGRVLKDFRFSSQAERELAAELTRSGTLGLSEMYDGLHVQTGAHVGRICLGGLSITVQPKVGQTELLKLLRYAFGFEQARFYAPVEYAETGDLFLDLLIQQLDAEARSLLNRGVMKAYVRTSEHLHSPRGHIEFGEIARAGGVLSASLPCSHHPRSSDHLLNQVMVTALMLAASLTSRTSLRRSVNRTRALAESVATPCVLSHELLRRARNSLTRLNSHYGPLLELVTMLFMGTRLDLEDAAVTRRLPGFLLDMNRLWQRLLERFLTEHLQGHTVESEHKMQQSMMRYVHGKNPQRRRDPKLRPDYAVRRGGKVVALLDAKYRDLWVNPLPHKMLYQLSMYALSQPEVFTSAILYPTTDAGATSALIEITDPSTGAPAAYVEMRPVVLSRLADLLVGRGDTVLAKRAALARELSLGTRAEEA